jgi:hypothetical protein
MFMRSLCNLSVIPLTALVALVLSNDCASAQRGGGGSRGGGAGARAGFTGSTGVLTAPTMHDYQGTLMRLPQQSTRANGAAGSGPAVSTAPKSADPPASAAVLLMNSNLTASPTAAPPARAATPMSAIAAPLGELQPLAPLTPPIDTTTLGRGATTSTSVSPYFSYSAPASPSQAAPSLPGGGGDTLEDCMGFWDRATHMTKSEWRAACQRTLHRLDDVAKEFAPKPSPAQPSQ